MAAVEGTQCFLTHNWANGNHERVAAVNRALKALGIVTWFDDERMEGQVRKKMAEGIENTHCIVVFITALYRDKVNGGDMRDNCQYELSYAVEQLGPQKMIPVVMEPEMRDSKKWRGQLGAALGGLLYVDMCGVEEGTEAFTARIRDIKVRVLAHSPIKAFRRSSLAAPVAAAVRVRTSENPGKRLFNAAKAGRADDVRAMVSDFAGNESVLNQVVLGLTPLLIAAIDGHHECVDILCKTRGVDINRGDLCGGTAVFCAASYGNTEALAVLVSAPGVDVNKAPTSGDCKGKTPLVMAN